VHLDQARRPLTLWRAARRLRALIRDERIEIVHAHMVTGYLLARLLRPGARWRLVASVHNEWQRSSTLMGGADRVITMSEDAIARLTARACTARACGPCATARSAVRASSRRRPTTPRCGSRPS